MITDKDIPQLRRLWQQAFGDTEDFLDGFFTVGFAPDRCCCIRVEDKIAAALYWFNCRWGSKQVAYIYAVATDAAYRGRGLCRQLMEKTHCYLKENGYSGAVLVPVEESLIDMYAKFGYRCFCPVKKATSANVPEATAISPEEYCRLRQERLGENAILHGITGLQVLGIYGGFYKTESSIFCGYHQENVFHFEEFLGLVPPAQEVFSQAMYLALDDTETLPQYFAIPLN